ncbi:MAG: hypothetical protein V1853_01905 [bacterium]
MGKQKPGSAKAMTEEEVIGLLIRGSDQNGQPLTSLLGELFNGLLDEKKLELLAKPEVLKGLIGN